MRTRKYSNRDLPVMTEIWNELIEAGEAFPATEPFDATSGEKFFSSQTYCAVAVDFGGNLHGIYTIYSETEGGIANVKFAVRNCSRCQKGAQDLMNDCLKVAKEKGYSGLISDPIAESNEIAKHIFEKMGFELKEKIPGGYIMKDGQVINALIYQLQL